MKATIKVDVTEKQHLQKVWVFGQLLKTAESGEPDVNRKKWKAKLVKEHQNYRTASRCTWKAPKVQGKVEKCENRKTS